MKKNYLRPEAEILDIEVGVIMLDNSISEGEDNQDPGPGDAGNHRGDWGNIWGEEK